MWVCAFSLSVREVETGGFLGYLGQITQSTWTLARDSNSIISQLNLKNKSKAEL